MDDHFEIELSRGKLILLIIVTVLIIASTVGIVVHFRKKAPDKVTENSSTFERILPNKSGLKRIALNSKKSFPLANKLKGLNSNIDEYIKTSAGTESYSETPSSTASNNMNASLAGKIIVIDPGHGTPDNLGSTGPSGLTENMVVLDVSKRLKKLLEKDSAIVHLTRDTANTDITNLARGELANTNKAHLFLRIHADKAVDDKQTPGFQIKYYKEDSSELALIFEKVIKDTNRPSLGVHRRFEEALDKAQMPSITIDLAKISNSDEEVLLRSDSFLNSMANAMYRATKEYFINYSD